MKIRSSKKISAKWVPVFSVFSFLIGMLITTRSLYLNLLTFSLYSFSYMIHLSSGFVFCVLSFFSFVWNWTLKLGSVCSLCWSKFKFLWLVVVLISEQQHRCYFSGCGNHQNLTGCYCQITDMSKNYKWCQGIVLLKRYVLFIVNFFSSIFTFFFKLCSLILKSMWVFLNVSHAACAGWGCNE